MKQPIEITVKEAKSMLDEDPSIRLLDVREDWEIAAASLERAEQITEALVDDMLKTADRAAKYMFLCHGGVRSLAAADFFARNNFENTYSIVGGIDAWSCEIDPSVPRY